MTASRLCLLLFAGPAVALAAAAGCRGSQPATPPHSILENRFAGNAACAECHPKESKAHAGSNHDRTLRTADLKTLADLAPPIGKIPGTKYAVERAGDSVIFERSDDPEKKARMEYAFGSGKT